MSGSGIHQGVSESKSIQWQGICLVHTSKTSCEIVVNSNSTEHAEAEARAKKCKQMDRKSFVSTPGLTYCNVSFTAIDVPTTFLYNSM